MAKGGKCENEVCTLLSLWFTEGERDDIFRRSASSGARFTQRRKSGKDTAYSAGDITFQDPIGKPLIEVWNIEVKTGYGRKRGVEIVRWDVLDFLDSKQKEPVLQKMWNQCKHDAEATRRHSVLIFRRNGRSLCICLEKGYLNYLIEYYGTNYPISVEIKEMVIFLLKDFFEWIPNIKISLKTGGLK